MNQRPQGEITQYAMWLVAARREEVARADGKATVLLASTGVADGALFGAAVARGWSPSSLPAGVEWVWWLGVAALVVSLVALGVAAYPRRALDAAPPVLLSSLEQAVTAPPDGMAEQVLDPLGTVLREQAGDMARVAVTKHRAMRVALWSLAAGGAGCLSALGVNLVA